MNNGVLYLAVGLVAGLMIGQSLKQCPTAAAPPAKTSNAWDVLTGAVTTGLPIVGKWFD
jgi:hypothetical protein